MIDTLKQRCTQLAGYLGIDNQEEFLQLLLRMTLITLYASHIPYSLYLHWLLLPGILLPRVATNTIYWMSISLVFCLFCLFFGIRQAIDNHNYLFALVLLLGAITLRFRDQGKAWYDYLAFNSRVVIGLVFLFATLGKMFSYEFTSSAFTEYLLILDERFKGLTAFLLKGHDGFLAENRAVLESLKTTGSLLPGIYAVASTPFLEKAALFLTWWTLLIEGALAVLYLLPERLRITRYRDAIMIIFIVTTYPVATVPGFAKLLITLAFISSSLYYRKEKNYLFPLIYLLIFCTFFVFSLPYARLLKLVL